MKELFIEKLKLPRCRNRCTIPSNFRGNHMKGFSGRDGYKFCSFVRQYFFEWKKTYTPQKFYFECIFILNEINYKNFDTYF